MLDLKWIDDRNAVAAFGSNVQMLKMPESSNFLLQEPDSMIGSVIGQHQSELREVAVCDASPAIIASGGSYTINISGTFIDAKAMIDKYKFMM